MFVWFALSRVSCNFAFLSKPGAGRAAPAKPKPRLLKSRTKMALIWSYLMGSNEIWWMCWPYKVSDLDNWEVCFCFLWQHRISRPGKIPAKVVWCWVSQAAFVNYSFHCVYTFMLQPAQQIYGCYTHRHAHSGVISFQPLPGKISRHHLFVFERATLFTLPTLCLCTKSSQQRRFRRNVDGDSITQRTGSASLKHGIWRTLLLLLKATGSNVFKRLYNV